MGRAQSCVTDSDPSILADDDSYISDVTYAISKAHNKQ